MNIETVELISHSSYEPRDSHSVVLDSQSL